MEFKATKQAKRLRANRIAHGEDSWPSSHMCFYKCDHTLFLSAIVLRWRVSTAIQLLSHTLKSEKKAEKRKKIQMQKNNNNANLKKKHSIESCSDKSVHTIKKLPRNLSPLYREKSAEQGLKHNTMHVICLCTGINSSQNEHLAQQQHYTITRGKGDVQLLLD